jgi:hypothetical protein
MLVSRRTTGLPPFFAGSAARANPQDNRKTAVERNALRKGALLGSGIMETFYATPVFLEKRAA